ncbi:MAG: hypothetical protein IMZ61_12980 [Planctomycetes bacterium]|nr:hypothetical protein [Planctomycetota bacterium]
MAISVCFRDYGGGLLEWGYSKREPVSGPRLPTTYEKIKASEDEIRERAARRAGTAVRRWIMVRKLDYLLTLTYRDEVTDRKQAVSDLSRFMERVRKETAGVFSWVAVPEIQPLRLVRTGAAVWHWHIAVRGFQNVRLLRRLWLGVVGAGNIDVRAPRDGKGARWGRLRLAYYLSKYIFKCAQETESGGHRYFRSRDGEECDVVRVLVDRVSSVGAWILDLVTVSGLRVRQTFEAAFGGWGATWESQRKGFNPRIAAALA